MTFIQRIMLATLLAVPAAHAEPVTLDCQRNFEHPDWGLGRAVIWTWPHLQIRFNPNNDAFEYRPTTDWIHTTTVSVSASEARADSWKNHRERRTKQESPVRRQYSLYLDRPTGVLTVVRKPDSKWPFRWAKRYTQRYRCEAQTGA